MEISRQTETEQPVFATCEPVNFCLSMCKLLNDSDSLQTGLTSDVFCIFGWRGPKLG